MSYMTPTRPSTPWSIVPANSAAPDGTALAIARLPFAFTQDELLTADAFLKQAERRGHQISLAVLSDLHDLGILKPLFRVGDVAAVGRRIDVPDSADMNPRGWFLQAAAAGRLRDVASEGRTISEPYQRPADETDRRWWNGFLYSSWQLITVGSALTEYELHQRGWGSPASRTLSDRARPGILALCTLSTRHLPSILGTYSIPAGYDGEGLWRSRFDIDDRERLSLVSFNAAGLRSHAEDLLMRAHDTDPMIDWLPLLRHASHKAWQKLKEKPLEAHEKRVAAEILLRAHEELAEDGLLEPLPELGRQGWWTPLHDRLTAGAAADSLDHALGTFGLSPYPRVLMLLEGDTEMVHVPKLLALYGLDRPDRVRVQNVGGSRVNPQLIARYAVSPRIGPARGGEQFLDATPTALVVAMDPENKWATEADRTAQREKLQAAIREEVQRQGADITDKDLDFLVRVFVWGDQTYEFANFTDLELTDALVELATEQKTAGSDTADWRRQAEAEFAAARGSRQDAGVAIGRMRVRTNKPRLAELLWPTLLQEVEAAESDATMGRPVHELVRMVREVVSRLSASGYTLDQPSVSPET